MDATSHPKKSRRKKLHVEELVAIIKALLKYLNGNFQDVAFETIFSPTELDEHDRRLGPNAISIQIIKASLDVQVPVLKLILDSLDVFILNADHPTFNISTLFWSRKALKAFLQCHLNTIEETPPWHDLSRNAIAAEVIKAIEDIWFTNRRMLGDFAQEEAIKIFESDNQFYRDHKSSTWGY